MALVEALNAAPSSSVAWRDLLAHINKFSGGAEHAKERDRIFRKATSLVPATDPDPAHLEIWLANVANQQAAGNISGAIGTIKFMKSIAALEGGAALYLRWSALEFAAGDKAAAQEALRQGLLKVAVVRPPLHA